MTEGGYAVAWLNADRGRILGPARTQEIQEGDTIKLSVFGKYVDPKKFRLFPASFIRIGDLSSVASQLNELGQQYAGSGPNQLLLANAIMLVLSDLNKKPVPEAYMAYALYDRDSNMYDSGKILLSKKARNKHEELKKDIFVEKDGYIEAFVVNETSENIWYDNFSIQSTGPIVVQETHYDPWGVELQGLGYQEPGIKVNKYLYNGKEFNDHLGVNLFDYGARLYDAAIGRWFVVDPLAEAAPDWTPFRYGFNNPVKFIDPDGMFEYSDGYSTQDSRNTTGAVGFSGVYQGKSSDLMSGSSGSSTVIAHTEEGGNVVVPAGGIGGGCCPDGDERKINSKHPTEMKRSPEGGYGYTGVSVKKDGQIWYQMSDRAGRNFWVDKDWNSQEKASMFSYFPGGKNFQNTNMGESNLGKYIQNDFIYLIDNLLWIYFPKIPKGTMPGQPYFGPGLPLVNPYSNNPKIEL